MMQKQIPFLNYHSFGNSLPGQDFRYVLPPDVFRKQLNLLKNLGYTIAGVDSYLSGANAENDKLAVLTIDDGHESVYFTAFPIMQEVGAMGTLFVVTNWLDTPGYVSWQQLKEMKSAGIKVESHSHTHRYLSSLSPDEVEKELQISRALLNEKLGQDTQGLSLPGGYGGPSIPPLAKKLGYRYICTSNWGLNAWNADLFRLKRIAIKSGMSLHDFRRLVSGNIMVLGRIRFKKACLLVIKHILGIRNYEKVRNFISPNP